MSAAAGPIRVVVVDDHEMFVELVAQLGPFRGLEVVGWASTAAEGAAAILACRPDVVVVDYGLPDATGADVARFTRRHVPGAAVLMLTGSHAARAAYEAVAAGCAGFVAKTQGADALFAAIQRVAGGKPAFPADADRVTPRLDELVVHYQPLVDLRSGLAVGAEALVRWRHPSSGLLGPDRFIAAAEESGFIVPLGWHVLHEACQQARTWRRELPGAHDLTVSVNVSAQQLVQPDVVDVVAGALRAADLPPSALALEITETEIMADDRAVASRLDELRSMGVEIEVDDFGTGHSSLANLSRFPVGALKVDQRFVRGMHESVQDYEIVAASIRLAHTLGLRAVAEGLEREEQRDRLHELHCDLAQGFLFSRPLVCGDFDAWFRTHRPAGAARTPGPPAPHRYVYVHCGSCHRKGAYTVPEKGIVRCKLCQAWVRAPSGVDDELTAEQVAARLGEGRTGARGGGCPACARWRELPGDEPPG